VAALRARPNGGRTPPGSGPLTTVFDTSVLIAHLRGEARASALLQSVRNDERLASVLARVEIEGGMRSPERSQVASLLAVIRLLPVTDAIARRAGEHLRRFRRSHPGIDLVDYVVAATAELHDAELATLNVRHFPMFKGLRPPW
jgi:predicted nucleic acid-binding protein